jgi:2-phosphosulfolactate phosphatase
MSPEAQAAVSTFRAARDHLPELVMTCASGRELMALAFARDVQLAAELNVSSCVPVLESGAFVAGPD